MHLVLANCSGRQVNTPWLPGYHIDLRLREQTFKNMFVPLVTAHQQDLGKAHVSCHYNFPSCATLIRLPPEPHQSQTANDWSPSWSTSETFFQEYFLLHFTVWKKKRFGILCFPVSSHVSKWISQQLSKRFHFFHPLCPVSHDWTKLILWIYRVLVTGEVSCT